MKKKLNPTCYQGANTHSQHFEGWYFKIVDKTERHLYAIIPGIFIDKNDASRHAFIQIFDGVNNKSYYFKFPSTDFYFTDNVFEIQIGPNYFSAEQLVLDIKDSSFNICGKLNFSKLTKWPKTIISPGIMGWYTWVPFMECYHGIVSLDHKINSALTINNENVDFSDGIGYTEKDWGKSFPEAWIWVQSNHFGSSNVSITGSIAIIPWMNKPFLGFIFGLWHKGKLYRFTTYSGAKLIQFEINSNKVSLVIKQKHLYLEIKATYMEGGFLQAPEINGMTRDISESIKSVLAIKLVNGSETILDDTGRHAGFEIAGDIQRLLDMWNKTNRNQ
ncbi:hypothetical protein JW964_10675 [candidate division KSB1 bacterium]|nr:hypothetical protein [candidate division KSB1 bacterium]